VDEVIGGSEEVDKLAATAAGRVSRIRSARAASMALSILCLAVPWSPFAQAQEPSPGFFPGVKEFGLTEEQYASTIESVQAEVASCMAAAGFEYIPVDVQTIALAQSAVRTEPGIDRRAYKEQWGLGVTTRFDDRVKEIELGPNLAILENLSQADREAYERTLYGADPDATFAFGFDEEDFEGIGGCTEAAVVASFPEEMLEETFINPKDLLIGEDPRILKADEDWAVCMADAGYEYTDQDEIIEEYQDNLEALLDGGDPDELSGPRLERLADLQQREIEVSLVDLDCQIEFVDHVYREVEIEVFGFPVSD
jgi:hypothetical protein